MITAPRSRWLRCALRRTAAFSLPETVASMAVAAIAVGGAMAANSSALKLVSTTRESNAASLSMEERLEQLRIANWRQITDSAYLRDTFFATAPKSIAPLNGYTERVVISAWPDPTAAGQVVVEKTKGSTANVITAGTGLSDQRLAKLDIRLSWTSTQGRTRTRDLTTIISNGGISRMNLPAMGAAAGSSADTTTSTSGTTTTTTTTDTTTTTPGNNGNGNGRGNVGGKPGQE